MQLIDGLFNLASANAPNYSNITLGSSPGVKDYFPEARIGNGIFLYVWSGGTYYPLWNPNGYNYFSLSAVSAINSGAVVSSPGLSPNQAQNIDVKIDDGLPQTGNIVAIYINSQPIWTDGTVPFYNPPNTGATSASSSTCFDNGGVAGQQHYSNGSQSGDNPNCGLSFRF